MWSGATRRFLSYQGNPKPPVAELVTFPEVFDHVPTTVGRMTMTTPRFPVIGICCIGGLGGRTCSSMM